MSETNKEIVAQSGKEIAINNGSDRIKNMWRDFEIKKSRGGVFIAFDDYRQSLGGRGIWGTKIFFRALIDLKFIMLCPEDSESKSKYCPTEYSLEKYGDLLMFDNTENTWGLSQDNIDEFDNKIFPHLLSTARLLEKKFEIEKKDKAQARYKREKAIKEASKSVVSEDLI